MKKIGLAALAFVAAFLFLGTFLIHAPGEPGDAPMDGYFLQNARGETGSDNVVAAVVLDYRGYDTLGEATVLFASVVAVTIIFKRGWKM